MATSNKAALKAAKAALDAKDYEKAAAEARSVLIHDPNHYHANVFLGLALERGRQYEEAERVYDHAVKIRNDDSLVWQGLIGLYEQQANKKLNEYAKAVRQLASILITADGRTRCLSVVDKYIEFVKQHGTKLQYKDALDLTLPGTDVYDYLEGQLPDPALTYPKIAEIIEADEKQRINKLIGERKTRLGAKISQVTADAKREVFAKSQLLELYQKVIDWAKDDDLRWLYEEKLLQRAYDILSVTDRAVKESKRPQVLKLAAGMVIVKHPFHLAWKIALEWKDVESTKEMDAQILTDYTKHFPDDGLTKILNGWFSSSICPFPKVDDPPLAAADEQDDEQAKNAPILSEEERLISMTEGLEESTRSVLSQRLMAEYYLHIEEHSSCVEAARKAKELISIEEQISGLKFQNSQDAMDIILATSLVHYQTPRYHGDARRLFENILERKPQSTPCLIGLGLILEEEEDFNGAVEFLSKTLWQSPDFKIKAEAAWCKALAGDNTTGLSELQACLHELQESSELDSSFRSQLLYRIGMCLWNENTSKAARKDRTRGYSYFLSSLQANMDYAPAYTSLGIFYSDYGKDKKRARKCFQKAFELSPSEVQAAERLARSFADHKEWDLVELVAQRVIDSGKTRPPPGSKKAGLSWPYAALGVCQINSLEFAKSIVSFQSALRSAPEDVHSWIGLGESYNGSGRYISAMKAFEQVQEIQMRSENPDEEASWYSQYMLANVERELGQYDAAIASFEDVHTLKPDEYGVSIALLQTHVESAWHNIALGLFGRSAGNARSALQIAETLIMGNGSAFNLWKAVGDACATFTWNHGWSQALELSKLQDILSANAEERHYSTLSDIDGVGQDKVAGLATSLGVLEATIYSAILAHKRAIFCCSHDIHAQAVAWYNLGWTEYRAHIVFSEERGTKASSTTAFLKAAVRCFKRAIELEAGNSEFWNSLAIVAANLNPKVAQHAFVRSLYLNGNSAKVWTNLGTFYLLHNDTDLAIEALNRGQSTDPDYAPAWIGQGLLALLAGDMREANNLFTHAFEIADSTSLIGKRLFASTMFDHLLATKASNNDLSTLLQPLFALFQLKSQAPHDVVYRHLSCLLGERVGNHGAAAGLLEAICGDIEAEYEVSESEATLGRFAQAKADLARACLAAEDFPAAAEHAETALDLSEESHNESREKCRLSAHLTAGLAYNYLDDSRKAISMFRSALTESSSNPDAVCLLAQVLWAKGGEDERNVAREQLLDCIESHSEHAGTITLLAVIAVLDDDAETLDAVSTDLHSLRARSDLSLKQKLQVSRVLAVIARLKDGELHPLHAAPQAEATASTMVAPGQPGGWTQLTQLAHAESYPAQMALVTALRAVPPKGSADAEDIAVAYAGADRAADAQRAVMLAPWVTAGWEGLAGNGSP